MPSKLKFLVPACVILKSQQRKCEYMFTTNLIMTQCPASSHEAF